MSEIGAVLGVPVKNDTRITGWSVDSRTIAPGDLFFALRGPKQRRQRVRGGSASKRGCGGHRQCEPVQGPVLVVADTLIALQGVASWARDQWGGEVVGVTGSAGKTSTKDVIAAMLASAMPTGKTIGNLNNHVGVPLSILRLAREARVAVLEMGMNHGGEIRDLCAIARPRIGVVTNVGQAHVENFDSIAGRGGGQARADRLAAGGRHRRAQRRRPTGHPVPRNASGQDDHFRLRPGRGLSRRARRNPFRRPALPVLWRRFRELAARPPQRIEHTGRTGRGFDFRHYARPADRGREGTEGPGDARGAHSTRRHFDFERLLQLQSRRRSRHDRRASGDTGTTAHCRAGGDARARALVRVPSSRRGSLCRCEWD